MIKTCINNVGYSPQFFAHAYLHHSGVYAYYKDTVFYGRYTKGLKRLDAIGVNPITIPRDWNINYIENPIKDEFIFNQNTVDYVLQLLMEKGQQIPEKDHPGKTIIFATNHKYAVYIEERFNELYP